MGSICTYFNFGAQNGVHLHIFQFWGRKWCPFTHISNLGAGSGVHLHIGGFGEKFVRTPLPGNRFRFRFVSVSCVRAGEAKLRERVRETMLPFAGATAAEKSFAGGRLIFFLFAAICMGVKVFFPRSMLYAWAFWCKRRSLCYTHGL